MKYRTRIQYTETDKALMWERWRQGESLQAIAQLFDRNHSTVGGILARTGGIRPSARRRSVLALKLPEREEISRGVMAGRSMRSAKRGKFVRRPHELSGGAGLEGRVTGIRYDPKFCLRPSAVQIPSAAHRTDNIVATVDDNCRNLANPRHLIQQLPVSAKEASMEEIVASNARQRSSERGSAG